MFDYHINKNKLVNCLKNSGIYQENFDYNVDGLTESFTFDIPKELMYVMYIHEDAFLNYLPIFIKEEFAKRTDKEVIIGGPMSFEFLGEKLLNETKIAMKVSGKVKLI